MKRKNILKLTSLILLSIVLLISCNNRKTKDNEFNKDGYLIKTYQVDSSGWGYDIYKNKKMIIHQPNIPSINSNQSFRTQIIAQKTAEMVIEKLINNVFPPSLTKEEVENLID